MGTATSFHACTSASDLRCHRSLQRPQLCALAGWQALDMGRLTEAWQHHERGKAAAKESSSPEFEAHVTAEQAFVLIDLGEIKEAVELLVAVQHKSKRRLGQLMQAWLTAAHGEALAAMLQRSESVRAFDQALTLLPPAAPPRDSGPYVVLDTVHLERWRGHALARLGEPEAAEVLTRALAMLDPTFVRAATALRIDLASALLATNEQEQAGLIMNQARAFAADIGSERQTRRILTMWRNVDSKTRHR